MLFTDVEHFIDPGAGDRNVRQTGGEFLGNLFEGRACASIRLRRADSRYAATR